MRCLMLIKHSESVREQKIPQALMDAVGKWAEAGMKSGLIVDTNGLRPTKEAKRIRQSGGAITVIDGPFTEAKEVIGGFAMFEVNSPEHALDVAREFVEIHRRTWPEFEFEVELRPVDR